MARMTPLDTAPHGARPLARAARALGLVRSAPEAQGAGDMLPGIVPPRRDAAAVVSPREALGLDSVFRAVAILHTSALQLSVDVWRGTAPLPEAPPIARRPDPARPASAVWAETVVSMTLRGAAYWRVHRGPDGAVAAVTVLDPTMCVPQLDGDGRRTTGYRGRTYGPADILQLAYLRIPGEAAPLGPIQAAARGLAGAVRVQDYGDAWLDTTSVPNGVLSTAATITAEQAARARQQWREANSFEGGPAVLGNGLTYAPTLLSPAEVQWIESQKFSGTRIARLFGIPSSYLLANTEGSSLTYKNQEQEDQGFVRYTLMLYLREMEEALTYLLPRGQTARFNVDALLRSDTTNRYKAHNIAIKAGFLTVDEVRAIEGRNPLPTTAELPGRNPLHITAEVPA